MAMQQEHGPPEVILKLVFPFLKGKQLIKNCELVCKRWKKYLDDDDVWRPICDGHVEWYEQILRRSRERNNSVVNMEEVNMEEYWSPIHEILVTQKSSGRPFRDIFILSKRLGYLLWEHELRGPDVPIMREDNRTLREVCRHDYRWIVGPTIETLRQLFDDPGKEERLGEVTEMKNRLLNHARVKSALRKPSPGYDMGKEYLATCLGQYLIAASSHRSFADNAFIPSSLMNSTIGEIAEGIEGITGRKLVTPMTIQLKRTPEGLVKEFMYRPTTKDWPMNPVDGLSFLIYKMWPNLLDCDDFSPAEFNGAIKMWGATLNEPIRKLLLLIHEGLAAQFDDIEPLPQDSESSEIPLEALKRFVESRYEYVRKKISNIFWHDIEPSLRDSIFDMYTQHTRYFCDMIHQEYCPIYGGNDPEINARVLLDIFLEVVPVSRHTRAPGMTSNYCSEIPAMMEGVMNRWNQLVDLVRRDERVLWDPQTCSDLKSLESKFGTSLSFKERPSRDFCTRIMVERYLYQQLSSNSSIPGYYSMKENAEEILRDARKMTNEDGSARVMSNSEVLEFNTNAEKVVNEYRGYGAYIHIREHSMLALIPLLPHLSEFDSKRLVYAIFITGTHGNRVGFSHANFTDLESDGIPCPSDDSGLTDVFSWAHEDCFDRPGILDRLFGLVLPENIISAMCDFLLERLYHSSLNDVNSHKFKKATGVIPYMERFCYENPGKAVIVWDCLGQALQNAIAVVHELEVDDIGEKERHIFQSLTSTLLSSCIRTRALKVIPVIRRMYEGTQFALQPPTHISLETLITKINDAPRIFVDTGNYHSIIHDDLI